MSKASRSKKRPAAPARTGKTGPDRAIAEALFSPKDKNPYYFNGKPLLNLQELVDYLVAFTGEEGLWVASWLEYLGDGEVAERIRQNPGDFKHIVRDRYDELQKCLGTEATV